MLVAVALLSVTLTLGVACGDDDDDEDGEEVPTAEETVEADEPSAEGALDITALDFSYDAPDSIAGGLTTITMDNQGAALEGHQAQLFMLDDGVTFQQFSDTAATDETGAATLALGTTAGGPHGVLSGEQQTVIQDLQPGTYAMLCFFSGDDGVPHLAKGMLKELTVTEAAAEQPDTPAPDANVNLADFSFTGATTIPAGGATVQMINNGPQPHEMAVQKLAEGVTAEQVAQLFTSDAPPPEGPPPFTSAGGGGAIAAASDMYVQLDLEAGDYVLLCFVPDEATGAPHAALGMVAPLTVE
jgi:hypothetical protein